MLTMGCKPSVPQKYDFGEYHDGPTALESNFTKETIQGIECATGSTEEDPHSVIPEETPHDIRKIRDELFSQDSVVAVTHSTTSMTHQSSLGSYQSHFSSSSWGDDHEDKYDEADNEKVSNHCKQYHYPAALYEDLKSVKHFLPTTSATTKASLLRREQQGDRYSPRSIQSGMSSSGDSDEDGISIAHTISGDESMEIADTILEGVNASFPQFEALVDTMALALEPNGNYRMRPTVSFRALMDTMTEMEEAEVAYRGVSFDDSDGEETGVAAQDEFPGCDSNTTMVTSKSGTVPPSKSRKARVPKKSRRNLRHSYPILEQKHSSELLADIKALALLADNQSNKSRRQSSENMNRLDKTAGIDSHEKPTKYHRSDSVVHVSSDTMSICSELGKWM